MNIAHFTHFPFTLSFFPFPDCVSLTQLANPLSSLRTHENNSSLLEQEKEEENQHF
jgi:hypothetical protein